MACRLEIAGVVVRAVLGLCGCGVGASVENASPSACTVVSVGGWAVRLCSVVYKVWECVLSSGESTVVSWRRGVEVTRPCGLVV